MRADAGETVCFYILGAAAIDEMFDSTQSQTVSDINSAEGAEHMVLEILDPPSY